MKNKHLLVTIAFTIFGGPGFIGFYIPAWITHWHIPPDGRAWRIPLGFLLVAPYGFAGSPYIAAILVAADMRGLGIGSELIRFAERHFAGRAHLFLLVSSFNQKARSLYLRHGYECVGELKDYCMPGQSELILHKGLA